MPPPTPASNPDPDTIAAWLAGSLPEDERLALERHFDEHPDGLPISDMRCADFELPRANAADPHLAELIEIVKTKHAPRIPAPSAEAWREVVEPSDNPTILGTLGDYEVLEVIATGGMGILLRARDPELNRIAALKVLSPELANNATARERFLREARAAARLEHENILPIYGIHADAIPYFAMRHARGGSLQDALDSGRTLEFERLKSITRQIAAALASAHAAGIIHRDIKPANILLDGEQVWVCDFGIATTTDDPSLTYAGGIAGTPHFMSPEQAVGEKLDGRSDLFALGAILYRCVTGENAFAGNTTAAVLKNITSDGAALMSRQKILVPKWFERLVANLLANDPRMRPSDAAAVISAIDDEHSPRPKHTARRNRRLITGAAIACSVAALAIGALQIPVMKSLVNRALAARLDQAFTISGELGAYPGLSEAITAASDGDTIQLPATGHIEVDRLELPAGKSLTLRPAEAGARPTLTTKIAGAPGIITSAPLRLIDLDFVLKPGETGSGIVIAHGNAAAVEIENCQFTSHRKSPDAALVGQPHCIDLINGASCEISASDFNLEESTVITLSNSGAGESTSKLKIRATRMSAVHGIHHDGATPIGGGIAIDIAGLNFTGESFIKCSNRSSIASVRCSVADSEFNLTAPLFLISTLNAAAVKKRLQWHESGNTYPIGFNDVRIDNSHSGKTESLLPITDYGGIRAVIRGLIPNVGKGFVQIEGSDARYPDLSSAMEAAPAGATLLLSGKLKCEHEILSSLGGIHLRPAPGERPVVTATRPEHHALFLFGPSTVRGITFAREHSGGFAFPILGLKPDGADVLVEDCRFVVTQTGECEGGAALSLTDVGSAIVRRCVLASPQGDGVAVNFVNAATLPAKIDFEECLFASSSALGSFAKVAGTAATLRTHRCIAICDHFFSNNPNSMPGRFSFEVTESIIGARSRLLQFPNVSIDRLNQFLRWSGNNNDYPGDMRILHTPGQKPEMISGFDEMKALIPGTEEIAASRFPPVKDPRLRRTMTIESLRELLKDIDSPAVDILNLIDW